MNLRTADAAEDVPLPGSWTVRDATNRVLRNSVLNLAGLFVLVASNGVAVLLLARGLGREGLGEFYTLYALILVVQLVLEGGLTTMITRRLTQAPEAAEDIIAEAWGLAACVAFASALVFVVGGVIWAWLRADAALLLPCSLAGSGVCRHAGPALLRLRSARGRTIRR
jgi:O-antigen/teichoic acid export membrane protein